MHRCAFLTTSLASHFVTDDDLALDPLRRRGVAVEYVRWREDCDWDRFDLVVVRSPWDYQHDLEGFLGVLEAVRSVTRLENPLELIRWNARKRYLRDLEGAGAATIPTVWREGLAAGELAGLFDELDVPELVLKPVVGASGEDTFRVARADAARLESRLVALFDDRPVMVQPFLGAVLEQGELSVVLMEGRAAHALRKVPRAGEFRSQEEWGGQILPAAVPPELAERSEWLLRTAVELAGIADRVPLYGRADFIPTAAGWALGELELIEPALYLRTDPGAPDRFADAVVRRIRSTAGTSPV